jgi:regulatory protein YycI of two-component signal transduction system YycFG
MYWAKAKSMIIYIFIILNAFLFANIIFLISYYDISEDVIDSTKKILRSCNVTLKCKIPKSTPRINAYTFDDICTKNLINSKRDSNLNIKIISDNEFEIKYNKVPSYFYKNDKKGIKEDLIKVAKGLKMDIDDCYFDFIKNKNGKIEASGDAIRLEQDASKEVKETESKE